MMEIVASRSTGARRENNDMDKNSQVVQLLQHEGRILVGSYSVRWVKTGSQERVIKMFVSKYN